MNVENIWPLVSIIVPIYNSALYLNECIESILKQSYDNFELILVDDGSTDSSYSICKKYAVVDKRITVIHNVNHGVSFSRNCGISIAKGEFVTFCDADDLYAINHIELLVDSALKYDSDITVCNFVYYRDGSPLLRQSISESQILKKNELIKHMFITNYIGGFVWNKLFSKRILSNVCFPNDIDICEDTYFVFSALINANRIYYSSETTYYYRLSSSSTIGNINNLFTENGKSKYTLSFRRIIDNFTLDSIQVSYIRSGIFLLAVSLKCDYINQGGCNSDVISNLNLDAKLNFLPFVLCKDISVSKKAVCILNLFFNLRRLKK